MWDRDKGGGPCGSVWDVHDKLCWMARCSRNRKNRGPCVKCHGCLCADWWCAVVGEALIFAVPGSGSSRESHRDATGDVVVQFNSAGFYPLEKCNFDNHRDCCDVIAVTLFIFEYQYLLPSYLPRVRVR